MAVAVVVCRRITTVLYCTFTTQFIRLLSRVACCLPAVPVSRWVWRAVPCRRNRPFLLCFCVTVYTDRCACVGMYVTNYSSTPSVFKNGVTRWWLMAMELAHWQHCTRSVHVENLWIASNMRLLPCGLLSELLTSRLMQLFAMRACRCRSSSRGMCAYLKK